MAEQANYQGEHVGLRLNIDAVAALEEALQGLKYGWGYGGNSREVPLRLPDGRTLYLRLTSTEDGTIRDEHGDYVGDDGLAHGDVTGDLDAHAEARTVLDAATRSSLLFEVSDEQLAGDGPVDLEQVAHRRIDGAIDRLPYRYSRTDQWEQQIRERALEAARAALPGALENERAVRARVLDSLAAKDQAASTQADRLATPNQDESGVRAAAAMDDSEREPPRPVVRLRNDWDGIRRGYTDHARDRREMAADRARVGDDDSAAGWTRSAVRWDGLAQHARTSAVAADQADRVADPSGYARRLAEARHHPRPLDDSRDGGGGIVM